MILFAKVSKSYNGGKVKAVDHLDIQITSGKVFGFIGPNGAGKTTAIKLLTGILSPDEGCVALNGIDMARDPIAAKRTFGCAPDTFDMYERLTGVEYLNFMADIYSVGTAQRMAHMEKYLALFALENTAYQQIRSYSHGMKQKLAITGALLMLAGVAALCWRMNWPLWTAVAADVLVMPVGCTFVETANEQWSKSI